nr:hypothetical protein BaRGS_015612 [Batillaria attramentaria]
MKILALSRPGNYGTRDEVQRFDPMATEPRRLMSIKPRIKRFAASGDIEKPWITNILVTDNGRIVMADRSNMKVKVTWITCRRVSCVVDLYDIPWALAMLDTDLVAVTSLGDKVIRLIDVINEPVVVQEIRTEKRYRGICGNNRDDTVIVSCPAEGDIPASVDVITRDGHMLRTIMSGEGSGLRLPDYLFVRDGDVLVSDSSANAVFRVDLASGRLTHTYRHEDLVYPLQVTADRSGNVYVACHVKKIVLVMSKDGQRSRTLLGSKQCEGLLDVPYCVTVTDKGGVWVGATMAYQNYHYPVKMAGHGVSPGANPLHRGASPSHRLAPDHENRIQRNYKLLVDELAVEEVMDHLVTAMVFSFEDREHVVAGEGGSGSPSSSRRNKNRRFLDRLIRAGEQAYQPFLLALKETGQRQILEKLEETPTEQPPSYGTQSVDPMTATALRLMSIKPRIDKFATNGDTEKTWITNILVTDNGRIVMADRSNMKVKVSLMTGVSCVKLNVRPWALAMLDANLVAVTSLGDKVIRLVDVTNEPVVVQEIRTEKRYRGICGNNQDDTLVVSCPAEGDTPASVDVIARDGHVMRTIMSGEGSGLRLPDYLFVRDGDVLVSDSSANAVFRVDLASGRLTYTYRHEDLVYPLQVTA